jgi:phosphotransferase system enzyme I (PtsP)
MPVDACCVYLADTESGRLKLMATDGLDGASTSEALAPQDGLPALTANRREVVIVSHSATQPRSGMPPGTVDRAGSFLGMPLIHYHRVLGVLAAWKSPERPFDKDEVTFFVTLAAQLARVIHEAAAAEQVDRIRRGEVGDDTFIEGIRAAPGIAIGTIVLLDPLASLESIPDREVKDVAAEERAFNIALDEVRQDIIATIERLPPDVGEEARALFDVHRMMLGDQLLVSEAIRRIRAGNWALGAWRGAVVECARVFEQLEDPYLRARAEDVLEIGRRVLLRLQAGVPDRKQFPEHCILMGDVLGISDIAAVPAGRLAGIVSMRGSALAHTAILARALGIPAVVSLASLPSGRLHDNEMVLDGNEGRIYIRPSRKLLESFAERIRSEQALSTQLLSLRDLPAQTQDSVRIPLHANIGLNSDILLAQRAGAEGIGLYRTEYSFLIREDFPIEQEQYEAYRELLEAFSGQPVTLRTLDVGGDKLLSYFPNPEENPSLGCRGIRFSLDHPEIFLIQLRAMLRANEGLNNLRIMFPMISTVGELEEALGLLARAHRELLEEGESLTVPQVGVMIEVPAAVYLAGALARRVDFLSVGTNDLTQYMLAVDRNNAQVTTPYDGLHPAVLNGIQQVIKAAHLNRKPVSVCGEMAGDPAGALLLLAMGVDSLSMSAARLLNVKRVIRSFSLQRAKALLDAALSMDDGFAIHRLLNGALEE